MTDRLKTRLLVAIWGDRYIEEFCQVALPSFLSPGNIPALAADTDLGVIIMTTHESIGKIQNDPDIARLQSICPIHYLFIDDLITSGNYGVTLTLAYARGIQSCGAEQTETCFVFMNSDFILSDGSLRTLVERLKDGHRCVLAPSLRASSEPILPVLMSKVDRQRGVLTMSSRDMVKMTFEHLHPTVIGKMVTQDLTTCLTHNQIYWQVDETAILGRYFLVFMLAIRPEVPLGPINSYCDYGFIPEMVPSGEFLMLDDSDDFFMLELQATHQEGGLLRAGRSRPEEIARQLSSWTTRDHRRFGEVDVLFRTGDKPAELTQAKKDFAAFVSTVQRHIRKAPLAHQDHYYWVLGLRAWTSLKSGDMPWLITLPPEIARPYSEDQIKGALSILSAEPRIASLKKLPRHAYLALVSRIRRRAHRAPQVPVWDHLWLDYRLVRAWTKRHLSRHSSDRTLAICDVGSPFDRYFSKKKGFEVRIGLDELISTVRSWPGQRHARSAEIRHDFPACISSQHAQDPSAPQVGGDPAQTGRADRASLSSTCRARRTQATSPTS